MSTPNEYLEINKILQASNKRYFYLFNFGPCKILTYEEAKNNEVELLDFYSGDNKRKYDFSRFAITGRNQGVLLFGFEHGEYLGVFYCGSYPKTKHPIKLCKSFFDILPLEKLEENLMSEDDIYGFEERQFNSYEILETIEGVTPLNKDIRILFTEMFPSSILIDKNSDYKEVINNFFIKNKIEVNNLPDGRYHSMQFEELTRTIHKEYKINYFHTQFIPSDYYAIGIYNESKIAELLKLGLISDDDGFIGDNIYELLK